MAHWPDEDASFTLFSNMELELNPPQPEAVARVVAELVEERLPHPDPWWEAGLEAAIRP